MGQEAIHDLNNTLKIEFSSELCIGERIFEAHFHKNSEMIAVERGECFITINGKEYSLNEGQIAVILPYRVHYVKVRKNAVVRKTTFGENLGIAFLNAMPNANPSTPVFTPCENAFNLHLSILSSTFGNEYSEFVRVAPPSKRIMAKSVIYSTGGEYIDGVEFLKNSPKDEFSGMIERMTKYISDNYTKNISRASMAKEFGYNEQYLSRKIKNTLGVDFKKLLNQHRITRAFSLIQDTDKTYTEIAFESGFQSVRTFNQVCVATYGKTPRELGEEFANYNITHK